ncbi:MAG: hypothetical protein JW918_19400 [Anaerolineae bacterium]|nr:hypothetical protein [Anaerolineae bacterium]
MQSSDIAQIAVSFISTAGAVLCALLGKKAEKRQQAGKKGRGRETAPQPRFSKWTIGMWACILIAVVNTGFLGWRFLVPGPGTEVEISYPRNQAQVEQTEVVRGTSRAIPDGDVIWVVVLSQEAGRYYPQNYAAEVEAKGNWSSITYVGVEGDEGRKFDILAIVADKAAQDAFSAYLADARDKSDWPGLDKLPEGATVYSRITVTRK